MKTIVVDCRMLRASGVGTYLRSVLGRLIAKEIFQFVLIGNKGELSEWLTGQTTQVSVSIIHCAAPLYGIKEQWRLWQIILKNCDLYWAPHYVIPCLYNGKIMATIHDVFHLAMPQFVPNLAARIYARFMFAITVRKAAKILVVSNFTKDQLIRFTDIEKAKIKVIYNGGSTLPDNPSPKVLQRPYILYVGNVKPHKNLRRVIEAHSRIYADIQQPLVIVGKQKGFITEDIELNNMLKTISDNQVYFTGYISDQELAEYYKGATMLIFASLYEGFGLPALEAMSFGIPVLASRVASLPEVCGNAALYCNPYEIDDIVQKIKLVIYDLALRKNLIAEGTKQVKKFSWEDSANQHLQIMKEVLGNVDR